MRRLSAITIGVLLFCGLALQPALAEDWPLAILWPPSNFATQGAMDFAKLVKEKTEGKLNIVVHPGGALGYKGPDMLRVVKDGLVPIGEMLLGYVAGSEPILDFSTMPFLVADHKEAKALGTLSRPAMEKVFTKWNQRMLYWHFWPGAGLYSKKPIGSIEDLKDLKIRTFNAESTEWVKAAGGKPMTMPWGDVYMALFTGAIDAVLTSTVSGVDGKFWEVTPYFANLGFTFGYSAVTVNQNSFNKQPDKIKTALTDAAREIEAKQEQRVVTVDQSSAAELAKHNIKISEISPAFRLQCAKLCEPIWANWVKRTGPDGEALLKELRKITKR
ncbi:MAG: C4-dicarboxylate transporter, substrate-binding protein [Deltaproteobacteria bacterium]|nr:C4-dicarboxylate transporter, substrate-binding protein [Deltaproteobacteria bacterium]